MRRKNLLLSLRLLARDKVFSFINIGGLAIGLACSILIYLWVQDEFNYNTYHEHIDDIYMVRHWQQYGNTGFACSASPEAMAPAIKEAYPEIEYSSRLSCFVEQINLGNKKFMEELNAVDEDILEIFSFQIIAGTTKNFKNNSNIVVLSERMAKKFFGNEDPIGQNIILAGKFPYVVGAVFKDYPHNVSYKLDILVPSKILEKAKGFSLENWSGNMLYTFIRLKEGTDYKSVQEKAVSFLSDARGHKDADTPIVLDPIKRTHLYSFSGEGRIKTVKIFSLIGIFILLIACFNYTNLTTAKAGSREKEIGVRKASTASKANLVQQFMGESFLYTFLAINFGLIIARLFLPAFNHIANKELVLDYTNIEFLIGLFIIWISSSILAGIYPALVLASMPSISALKNSTKKQKGHFRKVLVSLQFAISIGLVICVLIMSLQIKHLKNIDMGINKDNIVYFQAQEQVMKHYQQIKAQLKKEAGILNVTHSQTMPFSGGWNGGGWNWEGKDPEYDPLVYFRYIDSDFIKSFGIPLLDGSFFESDPVPNQNDKEDPYSRVVINKTFADIAFPDGAIGKYLNDACEVIGVVDDYYFLSPTQKRYPLILVNTAINSGFIYVKIQNKDIKRSLKKINNIVNKYCPDVLVEHRFVDEDFGRLYRHQERMAKIFKSFASIAIIISCLGLFGLAAFYAKLRTKEIGIRKAVGAPVSTIIALLSKEIISLILISSIVACPLAWYYMKNWLNDLANRIQLEWWMFASGILLVLAIAMLTILYQAYAAATRNPVESIRYE